MSNDPSDNPTPEESISAQTLHQSAPVTPAPGAAVASPLTGQGPHKADPHHGQKKEKPKKPKGPPPAPSRQSVAAQMRPAPSKPSKLPPPPPQQHHYGEHDQQGNQQQPDNFSHLDPAMSSMLRRVLDAQKPPAQKFFLLLVPEDDWPRVEEFTEIDACVDRIKELIGEPYHVYPFMGHHMSITAGPNRFLKTPMGPVPLFEIPDPEEIDSQEHGWLGPKSNLNLPPTAEEVDQNRNETEDTDDSDEDAGDDENSEDTTEDQPDEDDTPVF